MSIIKIKQKELFAIQQGLKAINEDQTNMKGAPKKFKYAIGRNTVKVARAIDALNYSARWSKEYQDYNVERLALRKKMAKKDAKGMPMIQDNNYVIEDEDAFEEAHKELATKYEDHIAKKKETDQKYNDSMDDEIEFEIHEIKDEWVPDDISPGQLTGVIMLMEEEA